MWPPLVPLPFFLAASPQQVSVGTSYWGRFSGAKVSLDLFQIIEIISYD